MGQECLPGHTLRVGDPLLVRIRLAAGRILGFHDRALCACQPVIDLVKLGFVLGLDTEVREASVAAERADRKIHSRVFEHLFRVVVLDDGRLGRE